MKETKNIATTNVAATSVASESVNTSTATTATAEATQTTEATETTEATVEETAKAEEDRKKLLEDARKAEEDRIIKNEEKAERDREAAAGDLDKKMKKDFKFFCIILAAVWNHGLSDILEPIIGYRQNPTAEDLYNAMPELMLDDENHLHINGMGANPKYKGALVTYDKDGNKTGLFLANSKEEAEKTGKAISNIFVPIAEYEKDKKTLQFTTCNLSFKNVTKAYFQAYKCGGVCASIRAYRASEYYIAEHETDFDRLAEVYSSLKGAEALNYLTKPKAETKADAEPKAEATAETVSIAPEATTATEAAAV